MTVRNKRKKFPLIKIIFDERVGPNRTIEFTAGKLGAFYIIYDYDNDSYKEISLAAPGEKNYSVVPWENLDLGSQSVIEDVLFG